MTMIYIDNRPHEVKEGQNLLQACLSLGFNLPYFCWHPALNSVGACRQCAVKRFKDQSDERGEIVMACMTPADDGMRISIDNPEAREFRAGVIEWLMINHPHDCPVCDEGGECHLQDMTVMTGHDYREYRFKKRTHRNQYLGPFINHEMNRCIQCYRCVRFYRHYAGGRDFNVFACHDHVYFGRQRDGVLENEFSGNLVEICPTGVFTDKTVKRHYSRKWDLQTAPSICVHCGLGCNTIAGERYGELRRIRNRYHHLVNGYFLCDRGRYGYEFVNSEKRIRQPLQHKNRTLQPVSWQELQPYVSGLLAESKGIIGIGSPRASLEANFALRALVGAERFFSGMSDEEHKLIGRILAVLREGPARTPSLRDAGQSDAALVLGEDLTQTAPLLALTLRQLVHYKAARIAAKVHIPVWNAAGIREVVQQEKGRLFMATPFATKLDDAALKYLRAAPDELARFGFAVAKFLNPDVPVAPDLSAELRKVAGEVARTLTDAERPLIVSGISCGNEYLIQAAANIAWALNALGKKAEISFIVPECNSMGSALMGGRSLSHALQTVHQGDADTIVILENDLYRRTQPSVVHALFEAAKQVIVIDHLSHATACLADVVLPAATFAESSGTLVNNEGRAQRFYRVFVPAGEIRDSWRWLQEISGAAGHPGLGGWENLDQIVAAMAGTLPVFSTISQIAPGANFREAGTKIPRQSHRYSGRTAILADVDVHEPRPPDDIDSPLAFSMEGYEGQPPSALILRFWSPGWNSVQALNKFQNEVGGPLRGGDPGRRLIEPAGEAAAAYFAEVPPTAKPGSGDWILTRIHHLFGSEELSQSVTAIAEHAPGLYLAMHPKDADALTLAAGETVTIILGGVDQRLPVKLDHSLPRRVVAVPVGLVEWPFASLSAVIRIVRRQDHG
jgi:NADH-quinone oxidoreductase subunit G